MSNLHSILPLIDSESWRWDREIINQQQLRSAERVDLLSEPKYPGFIYFGTISIRGAEGNKTQIGIEFDQAETDRSIGRLFGSGATGSNGIGPSVTRFDTENDIYVTELTPTPPIAYLDNARISIRAPDSDGIEVDAFGIKLDILDIDMFATSYEQVTNGELINKMSKVDKRLEELNDNIRALGEAMDARENMRDGIDLEDGIDRKRSGGFGF